MPKVLAGIRVADFSHVMAGPFASHFLALLGADVVKVETREHGDPLRRYGDDRRYDGMAPAFIAANAGKRSLALDLKSEGGREVARRLIASSDVVLESFRPGVMDKLGLGYDACKALRPELVFCSVSGFGQNGPLRQHPAIDNTIQAISGLMSLGGEPGSPPQRVGIPVVDTYTGTLAAMAVLAALLQRARFGGGQRIDLSMLDASLVLMVSAVVPLLVTGSALTRTGNTGYSGQPTAGMFATRDGSLISLGVVQPNQFTALCRALGREELTRDPRFASAELRKQNAAELRELLASALRERDGAEWERLLCQAGAPAGLVRDVAGALGSEQLAARGVLQDVHIPGLPASEHVRVLNAGFEFAHDGPAVSGPPPRHGQHSDEILIALGFDAEQRAQLRASGAAYPTAAGADREPA